MTYLEALTVTPKSHSYARKPTLKLSFSRFALTITTSQPPELTLTSNSFIFFFFSGFKPASPCSPLLKHLTSTYALLLTQPELSLTQTQPHALFLLLFSPPAFLFSFPFPTISSSSSPFFSLPLFLLSFLSFFLRFFLRMRRGNERLLFFPLFSYPHLTLSPQTLNISSQPFNPYLKISTCNLHIPFHIQNLHTHLFSLSLSLSLSPSLSPSSSSSSFPLLLSSFMNGK